VFELLQNADDNSYTIAKSVSADPFVSFYVHDRHVIVECNEDGFTRENLVAICNVGKSSKTGAQGYIGEKGIGFKSVFMVAWKVHIQSREFSFSFRHREGDSGMGMISPSWEETDQVLPHSLTRITLFLHDDGPDEVLARQRQIVLQQFQELKATFLLFMRNIRRIEVRTHDHSDIEVSHTTFSLQSWPEGTVAVKEETVRNRIMMENTKHYHTTRFIAANIPPSENREYPDGEMRTRAYADAEIILSFPLTPELLPIIEPQEVYAFLPIRNMGLPVSSPSLPCNADHSLVPHPSGLCDGCQSTGYSQVFCSQYDAPPSYCPGIRSGYRTALHPPRPRLPVDEISTRYQMGI
jgi:hypothetical protein